MNRAGLLIALSLSLVFVVLYLSFPELDLRIGGAFYDAVTRTFPLRSDFHAMVARETAMIVAWAVCTPALAALVLKLARPDRPMLLRGRTVAFFIITIVLTAGIVTNLTFKTLWGRPRPVAVVEFNGQWQFKHWWQPGGECPKNCSFFSGEAATAFWTYAPALFGLATGGLRVAFGGHFVSDVLVAGLVTFLLVWLVHGLLYRWPSTRTTDERIEAWLAWVAWPGYSLIRRMLGRKPVPPASGDATAVPTRQ
jgi:lipid A 4'-phosphatase